jgi:hypothetical protein
MSALGHKRTLATLIWITSSARNTWRGENFSPNAFAARVDANPTARGANPLMASQITSNRLSVALVALGGDMSKDASLWKDSADKGH